MNISMTPTFDQLAFEFADQGDNVVAIMERPAWSMPGGIDVATRWQVVEGRFEKLSANQRKKLAAQHRKVQDARRQGA
jgi:hypothetical protein